MRPTRYISTAPGRQTPAAAASAPLAPVRRSPRRSDMLTAFSPGSDWLIVSTSTNVASSTQRCLTTTLLRMWATTPPPKLVAPISRKAAKMLLVPADCLSIQPIHQPGFGRPQRNPVTNVVLQVDEELLDEPLGLARDVLAPIEFDLKRVFADDRLVVAAPPPERDV